MFLISLLMIILLMYRELESYLCIIMFPDGLPGQSRIDYG
jgi:hypothetical protein